MKRDPEHEAARVAIRAALAAPKPERRQRLLDLGATLANYLERERREWKAERSTARSRA